MPAVLADSAMLLLASMALACQQELAETWPN